MRKILLTLLIVSSIHVVKAQRAEADIIGEVSVQPVVHGSLVLSATTTTIYVDPYGGASLYEGLNTPDLILITDIHGDHYDEKTLTGLKWSDAVIIAPQAVKDMMPSDLAAKTEVLANGDDTLIKGIGIKAIPMYNLPETDDSKHPKGRGNGYVLNIGEQRVYISGDTEDIPEMRELSDIDIAFVCMNLPYTMDVTQAADAVLEFEPAIIYPYHYRGRPEMSDTEQFKSLVDAGKKNIDVRLRNWYAQ